MPPSYWTRWRRRRRARRNALAKMQQPSTDVDRPQTDKLDNATALPAVPSIYVNAGVQRAASVSELNGQNARETVVQTASAVRAEQSDSDQAIPSDGDQAIPSEPSDDDDPQSQPPSPIELPKDLAVWVVKRNINLDAVDELLAILNHYKLPHLPKSARSLLKTPRSVELKEVNGGHYYHFGIAASAKYGLGLCNLPVPPPDTVMNLYVHIDGVSVSKSTNSEFYPILGKVTFSIGSVTHQSAVFFIGLYYGAAGKPGVAHGFLDDFVEDCNDVQSTGVTINDGCVFPVRLRAIICDAPARAFVKCMKGHGGYYACDFCKTRGEWYRTHRVVYPQRNSPLRTDASFRSPDPNSQAEIEHVNDGERSPLLGINDFDVVLDVVPEYMHTAAMGVMKRLAHMYFSQRSRHHLRGVDIDKASARLVMCGQWCPTELGRKPRGLHLRDKFKATEWRSMMLYTGFCILKGLQNDKSYQHFLLFACGMKILLCENLCRNYCDLANRMLRKYVKQYCQLYGRDSIVYNVHQLLHFANAASRHGSLEKISAFPFESYMYQLQVMLRKPSASLKQIVKRETERRRLRLPCQQPVDCKFLKRRTSGYVPTALKGSVTQFRAVRMRGVRFSVSGGDSYVFVKGEGVAHVVNVLRRSDDGKGVLVLRFFEEMRDHFTSPIASSQIGIWRTSKPSRAVQARKLEDCTKVWYMPFSSSYSLCMELAHDMLL